MEAGCSLLTRRIGDTSDKDQLSIINAKGWCPQGQPAGNANCTDSGIEARWFGSNRGLEAEPAGPGKRNKLENVMTQTATIKRAIGLALALTTAAGPVVADGLNFGSTQAPSVLVGTWRVTTTPYNCITGQVFPQASIHIYSGVLQDRRRPTAAGCIHGGLSTAVDFTQPAPAGVPS